MVENLNNAELYYSANFSTNIPALLLLSWFSWDLHRLQLQGTLWSKLKQASCPSDLFRMYRSKPISTCLSPGHRGSFRVGPISIESENFWWELWDTNMSLLLDIMRVHMWSLELMQFFFFTTKKESYLRIQLTLISQQKHFRSEGVSMNYSKWWKARTYNQDYSTQQSHHFKMKKK